MEVGVCLTYGYLRLLLFAALVLLVYASTQHAYIIFVYIAFLSIQRLQSVCILMSVRTLRQS